MLVRCLLFVALACAVLVPVSAYAQDTRASTPLRIVTFRPADDIAIKYALKVQREVYRRLGYEIEVSFAPGKRASLMTAEGEMDGELGRPIFYGEMHPNLVRVDEFYCRLRIMAYVTDPDLKLEGWESLQDTSLRVDYQRGMSNSMRHLKTIVPEELLHSVDSAEQGLKRLLLGRVDVYVDEYLGTEQVLILPRMKNFTLEHGNGRQIRSAGVMNEIALYPWLHKRHGHLAHRLAEIMREMKADGSFERYAAEVGGTWEMFRW